MDYQSTEFAFVLILSVLLVQSLGVTIVIFMINRRLRDIEGGMQRMGSRIVKALSSIKDILGQIVPLSSRLSTWPEQVLKASDSVMAAVRESDRLMTEGIGRIRAGARDAAERLDGVRQSFSEYSFRVHRGIIDPSRRISAAVEAIFATLKRVVFRGRSSIGPEFVSEEEGFI